MSSCGKAFVTLFHMFSSKPVDYLWAHVMPPLKPILPSAHPSQGDSLKQKLRSWDSFLQLVNWAHEEEKCQSCDGQSGFATDNCCFPLAAFLLFSTQHPDKNYINSMRTAMPTSPSLLLGVVVHWHRQGVSAQNFFSTNIQTDPEPAPEEAGCKIIFCGIPLSLERLEALHI